MHCLQGHDTSSAGNVRNCCLASLLIMVQGDSSGHHQISSMHSVISSMLPANASASMEAGLLGSLHEWRNVDLLLPILPVSNAAAFSRQQASLLKQGACKPQEAFTAAWPPSQREPAGSGDVPCGACHCSDAQSCHVSSKGSGGHSALAQSEDELCSACQGPCASPNADIPISSEACRLELQNSCNASRHGHPGLTERIWPFLGLRQQLWSGLKPHLAWADPLWQIAMDWLGWSLLSLARVSSLFEPLWLRYFSWLLEGELGPSFRCVQLQQQVTASWQDQASEDLWAVMHQPGPLSSIGQDIFC